MQLREGVFFCIANRQVVLLDLPADRYFALPARADAAFQRLAAGAAVSDETRSCLEALLAQGLLIDEPRSSPLLAHEVATPQTALVWNCSARPKSVDLVRGWITYQSTALRFQHRPLAHWIGKIAGRKCAATDRSCLFDLSACADQCNAFYTIRKIAPSRDLCLPWSIALVDYLAKADIYPQLVLGVRMKPYGAHAWVQAGNTVLNDEPDHVRRFTPILVV